jgi:NADH-quinone oxidoreductase subunit J
MIAQVYFWIFATVAVLCAGGVFASRHPINGAMSLVGTMAALAGIYSIIGSPFLATLQILVYAGAIMMLVVFVIMVLNSAKDHSTPFLDIVGLLGLAPAVALGALVSWVFLGLDAKATVAMDPAAPRGDVEAISKTLFGAGQHTGGWALLFLAIGVVLLTAIVGAVLLAKRHLAGDPAAKPAPEGGH